MKQWIREWIDFILALLVVMLLLGIGIGYMVHKNSVSDFWDSGAHTRGEYTHLSIKADCYLFGFDNGKPEIVDKSVFSISGIIHPYSKKDGYGFSGNMELDGFPLPMKMHADTFSGFYLDNSIQLSNQVVELMYPENEYWYTVSIAKSNPEIIVIRVVSDGNSVLAVSGGSEEQAMENYNYYMQNIFTDGK